MRYARQRHVVMLWCCDGISVEIWMLTQRSRRRCYCRRNSTRPYRRIPFAPRWHLWWGPVCWCQLRGTSGPSLPAVWPLCRRRHSPTRPSDTSTPRSRRSSRWTLSGRTFSLKLSTWMRGICYTFPADPMEILH